MSTVEWFITLWFGGLLLLCVAYLVRDAYRRYQWRNLGRMVEDYEMAEADAWCVQHVKNTANFHKADRYYREFQ